MSGAAEVLVIAHRDEGKATVVRSARTSDARGSRSRVAELFSSNQVFSISTHSPQQEHSVERVQYFSSSDMKVILKNEDVKSAKVAKYIEYRVQRWRSVITKWEEDRGLMPR